MSDPAFDAELQHKIRFGRYTIGVGTDDHGNPIATWPLDATDTPAFVQPRVATEFRDGQQVVISTHDVFVGPAVTFSQQDRIMWEGRAYNIVGCTDEYEPEGLHHRILAVLGVAGG